jgi:hypothetical protein
MDKRLISQGKLRIALNMAGFGTGLSFWVVITSVFSTGRGIFTGPGASGWLSLIVFLGFWLLIIFLTGFCLAGVVRGTAEIVRGVNANRPPPPIN